MQPNRYATLRKLLLSSLLGTLLAMAASPVIADGFRGVVTGIDLERQLISIDGRDYRVSLDTEMTHENNPNALIGSRNLQPGTRVRYRTAVATSGELPTLAELVVIDRE